MLATLFLPLVAAAAAAEGSSFDLIMSAFVTESRSLYAMSRSDQISRHRYARFDVLMYTLQTYARLPLDRVYLYLELDTKLPNVAELRRQLVANTSAAFGSRLVTLQHRRLTKQQEWRDEWNATFSDGADDPKRLIFFTQNALAPDPPSVKSLFLTDWRSFGCAGR